MLLSEGLAAQVAAQDVLSTATPVALSAALLRAPSDADSFYIQRYRRENDVRLFYGAQGSSLAYGSERKSDSEVNTAFYNNVNDLVGFGLSYKFIDFDLSYSLPEVRILDEDRQNLSQFKLVFSSTGRKLAVRASYSDSKGVIVVDQGGDFISAPDVHLSRIGIQLSYYFNNKKYSWRAANFQNELQRRSAGSFLLRFEPFYRSIGMKSPIVPAGLDTREIYGDQVGLSYVRSPGLIIMGGYGHNFAMYGGRFFVSPIVFAGPGLACNIYKAETGTQTKLNAEWAGSFALNVGYNGAKAYATLRGVYEVGYFKLNPSYFTTSDLKIMLTIGLRFCHLEKFIPTSVF